MNEGALGRTVVTAKLPSGEPIRVELTSSDSNDGMSNVGLRDLELAKALDAVTEIGSLLSEKLKTIKPTKATAEFRLGFSAEAGKLMALWIGGGAEASLTVTLEWVGTAEAIAPVEADG